LAEINIPASRLEQRRIDLGTGLPNLAVAWEDIARLSQSFDTAHCLGVIDVAILPDPVLLRLSPEASRDLRLEITRRLEAALRPQDRLYALEHWEWLVVLPELPSSAPLMLALIKFDALFAEPVRARDESMLLLRVACGGALCPDDGTEARHLVQSARIACLSADRSGSRYATYSPEMEQSDKVQQRLHVELPRALNGAPGLSLFLQPQIDLADGRCHACEALLRWQLPTGEWIAPPHTLVVVERLGLRSRFTRWLLQQAMQIQSRLRTEGIRIVLSINLSANDLLDAELPELIEQTLATWELPPDCLLLELTETLMIEDTERVIEILGRLRQQGFQLSVDDFGTGYASMSYLQRLPVQEVKIDQSFVLHAEHSGRDREIIASVVQLAHRLGMAVVAEGVETEAAAVIVRQLGCDRAQGYRYATALPLEQLITWWRGHESRR
jgi:EAL domain-containing protein (putative c-di-GMP-specific phosphodiesterase class I)